LKLILGSSSPRRLELLSQIGINPDEIRAPEIDEKCIKGESPRKYCNRVVLAKLNALTCSADEVILCGDTNVALGKRILGKPKDKVQAMNYLTALSGRRHRVITAIAVRANNKVWTKDVVSIVKFKVLAEKEVEDYIVSGDWEGKAGAYGIQGQASKFIPWISGSFSAIVGLPLFETNNLLVKAGYIMRKV
tara:strand:+ start:820 stop:1392 length:573 start_codon:yes stop_codon:yes gene_type:complete